MSGRRPSAPHGARDSPRLFVSERETPVDPLREWLRATHRPAHARRTAERNAAFFLSELRPGMSLLDIGCGPGSITAGLAARVAPGRTVGIDIDPATLPSAAERAAAGASNLDFRPGNAYDLPFRDGTFD